MESHVAIILHRGKKILFIQRAASKKSLPNIWAFPSGTIEKGETRDQATLREAYEELGIDIAVEKQMASINLFGDAVQLIFLACTQTCGKSIIFDPAEIKNSRWLTLDDFFRIYDDTRIGHGLRYLRQHSELWSSDFGE